MILDVPRIIRVLSFSKNGLEADLNRYFTSFTFLLVLRSPMLTLIIQSIYWVLNCGKCFLYSLQNDWDIPLSKVSLESDLRIIYIFMKDFLVQKQWNGVSF